MTEVTPTADQNREVMEALNELRSEVEKKSVDPVKVDKIQTHLDKVEEKLVKAEKEKQALEEANKSLEEKSAKLERDMTAYGNTTAEIKEQLQNLAKAHARHNNAGGRTEKAAEVKAFDKYGQFGKEGMDATEAKALISSDTTQGGVLIPYDYQIEISKNITEVSALRTVARVMTTSRNEVVIPARTALLSGGWVGSTETLSSTSQSSYGDNTINVNNIRIQVPVNRDTVSDSVFDIQAEVLSDVGERFAQIEGAGFITGTGAKMPEGILNNPNIQQFTSKSASTITADALILLTGELKTGYDPRWLFNRQTLAYIRTMKTTGSGEYIFQQGLPGQALSSAVPSTVLGDPFLITPDMPSIAAGALPVAYGDFKRGYRIADNTSMFMYRDDVTGLKDNNINFFFFKRVGGIVLLPEAIKLMLVSA